MGHRTKTILLLGIILTAYGYLCRMLNIYFFWDSKTIGVLLLLAALLSYWVDLRKRRIRQGKKLLWVTIGICFISLGLLIVPVVVTLLKTSDAYATATEFLTSNTAIQNEVGKIKRFGLIPTGSVQTRSYNGVESGDAIFDIIVIGENKNMDVTILLKKMPGEEWMVKNVK